MPQTALVLPLLAALNKQAAKALSSLQREIAQRETELARLKAEAERWKGIGGVPGRKAQSPAAAPQRPAPTTARLDWSAVLKELPGKFTLKEVHEKTKKPMQHVYVGIARWMKDKKVRKVEGGYQKNLQAPLSPRSTP